jgi:hypothetical protein
MQRTYAEAEMVTTIPANTVVKDAPLYGYQGDSLVEKRLMEDSKTGWELVSMIPRPNGIYLVNATFGKLQGNNIAGGRA